MNKENIYIRVATTDDAKEILDIYTPYIKKTAITFEYDVPSLEEFKDRIKGTLDRYPYIVAINDGEIMGYAYTGAFIGRQAYDRSVSTTIYIKENKRKMGIGKILYEALENITKFQNITNMYACIGYPEIDDEYLTKNSAEFHEYLGFTIIGTFQKCGYKFNRWYNMIWMEKIISEHSQNPLPIIAFPEISSEALIELGVEIS